MENKCNHKNDEELMRACRKQILAIHDALEIFKGKWKIPIIGALIHFRELRFKELQNIIGKVTSKMLSKELKELEMNLLVKRTVLDTSPTAIKYSITPHGESCKEIILALKKWGEQHRESIFGTDVNV